MKFHYPRSLVYLRKGIKCTRLVIVDGSGQGASWRMCVCSFISLEALLFEKRS